MTDITPSILGETVESEFRAQEKTIGTLPDGSTILELPAWARWIVVHPSEPTKAITADGRLVTLDHPTRKE